MVVVVREVIVILLCNGGSVFWTIVFDFMCSLSL